MSVKLCVTDPKGWSTTTTTTTSSVEQTVNVKNTATAHLRPTVSASVLECRSAGWLSVKDFNSFSWFRSKI